jgi:hypothetical protein
MLNLEPRQPQNGMWRPNREAAGLTHTPLVRLSSVVSPIISLIYIYVYIYSNWQDTKLYEHFMMLN